MCFAGLGKLVRTLQNRSEQFVVPLNIAASGDISIPIPEGPDLSAFDYPWVGSDPERYAKPTRVNRSNVIGLLMLKHGASARWHTMAARIAGLNESSGVTVGPTLSYPAGSKVMVSLREEAVERVMFKVARMAGFEVLPRPRGVIDKERAKALGKIEALVTRYPDSEVPVCQFTRAHKIPIYRPAEFVGGISEAMLADHLNDH